MFSSYFLVLRDSARSARKSEMAYLETLATRFVEREGLSTDDQDKIIADAAEC